MESTVNSTLSAFNYHLKIERHNPSIKEIYRNYIKEFLSEYPEAITENNEAKIIAYIHAKIKKNELTHYKEEHLFDAFYTFFNSFLKKDYNTLLIAHIFQVNKIPVILTKEEIKIIFKLTIDVRHKLFFMLVYYCGAKPTQILHIQLKHIHPQKKIIELYDEKEKFVRNMQISNEIIELIRQIKNLYKPNELLFNWKTDVLFNKRSMEVAFKLIVEESEIDKKATLSTLRHSWAIHMLEKCIDIKYVMKILGLTTKRSENIYLNYMGKVNLDIIKTLDD